MITEDNLELFADLEARIPVRDWTADGVRIWPLVRMLLAYRLALPQESRGGATPSRWSLLGKRLGIAVDSITAKVRDRRGALPRVAEADAFILTYAGARLARLRDGHFDIFCGPILKALEKLSKKTQVWEFSYTQPYRFPRSGPSYAVQASLFSILLKNRLLPSRAGQIHLPEYSLFRRSLEERQLYFPELSETRIAREISHIFRLRNLFEPALKRIRPRLVFTSNIGRYEFGLHLACHRLGIASVEVQHGVQAGNDGRYHGWTRVPQEGYSLLPQFYWSWDQKEADLINRWSAGCPPRHRAVVGGHPWVDYCRELGPEMLDDFSARLLAEPADRKTALVTLQPPHLVSDTGQAIPEFVLEAMAREGASWRWWVRLHPSMGRDYASVEEMLRRRGIRALVREATEVPLFVLLRKADLHLTHSSTVVVEAQHFGVRSIVWSEFGAALFDEEIRSGYCRFAGTTETFLDAARKIMEEGRGRPAEQKAPAASALQQLLEWSPAP